MSIIYWVVVRCIKVTLAVVEVFFLGNKHAFDAIRIRTYS